MDDQTALGAVAGKFITETFAYDGGRRVTVYLPPDSPEAVVFAGDGQLIAQWGGVLEAADVPSTLIVGVHRPMRRCGSRSTHRALPRHGSRHTSGIRTSTVRSSAPRQEGVSDRPCGAATVAAARTSSPARGSRSSARTRHI